MCVFVHSVVICLMVFATYGVYVCVCTCHAGLLINSTAANCSDRIISHFSHQYSPPFCPPIVLLLWWYTPEAFPSDTSLSSLFLSSLSCQGCFQHQLGLESLLYHYSFHFPVPFCHSIVLPLPLPLLYFFIFFLLTQLKGFVNFIARN